MAELKQNKELTENCYFSVLGFFLSTILFLFHFSFTFFVLFTYFVTIKSTDRLS